jgi:polar amino acid transport system substrate-binding protein
MIMKRTLTLILAIMMICTTLFVFASCGDGAKVKIIDVQLTNEEYAFVMKKGNTALKADFDAYLQTIQANGTFQTIVDKYFKGTGTKEGVDVTTTAVTNDASNLVVVTNCPFEPFEYIGDDGKIYGIDIEIAKGYAASKGLNLVVKNIAFDSIFSEVEAGYADIGMAGITITPDRQALYDFTTAYYNASQKIIVLADNTDFDGLTTAEQIEAKLKTLQGKSIGYQTGTTGNWYVAGSEDWGYDGFANITAKGYDTALDAINDMINGNIYAVVVDEAPGAAMVAGVNGN